jgi:hypothetical protein
LAAVREARGRADTLLDKTALTPVQQAWETESGGFMMRFQRLFRGKYRDPLTAQTTAVAVGFIQQEAPSIFGRLGLVLSSTSKITLEEGVGMTARVVAKVLQQDSPLAAADIVSKIVANRTEQISLLRQQSMLHVGQDVVGQLLQSTSHIKARVGDIILRAGDILDSNAWQLERTARTEASFAWNAAQADAIAGLRSRGYELRQRWTERIDDMTGRPLDAKVAADSKELHGQVCLPGESFIMPPGAAKMAGKRWLHPPNRPNDRAVLTPWMADWGIPGWIFRGRKIPL